jgi:hypothetical protein
MLLGYNEALFFVDAGGIGPYNLTMIGPALSLKQLGYVQHPTGSEPCLPLSNSNLPVHRFWFGSVGSTLVVTREVSVAARA